MVEHLDEIWNDRYLARTFKGERLRMFNTEKFISEIEKWPALYDTTYKYGDRAAKMKAWEEVCRAMFPHWSRLTKGEQDAEERNLRNKWRNIRDYFMKELKTQNGRKSGPGAPRKRKKYIYADKLTFLLPSLQTTSEPANFQRQCKTEESDDEESSDKPSIEEYEMMDPLNSHADEDSRGYGEGGKKNVESFKVRSVKFSRSFYESSMNSTENDTSTSSQREDIPVIHTDQDEDYDKMFLLSLLPILRSLPPHRKLLARIEMQQVLAAALSHSTVDK